VFPFLPRLRQDVNEVMVPITEARIVDRWTRHIGNMNDHANYVFSPHCTSVNTIVLSASSALSSPLKFKTKCELDHMCWPMLRE
jgi:hypothetical protein